MKLRIELDAAIVLDMFSILEVKKNNIDNAANRNKASDSWLHMFDDLERQFTLVRLNEIWQSVEYKNLYNANEKVFKAVDLAEDITKINEISAYEVAQLNLLRYECKKKLQEKFFNSNITEIKTGKYNDI